MCTYVCIRYVPVVQTYDSKDNTTQYVGLLMEYKCNIGTSHKITTKNIIQEAKV